MQCGRAADAHPDLAERAPGGPPTADAADNAAADNAPPPPPPPVFPRLLRDDEWLRLWHKTDATFRRPKANVYIDLLAPAAYHSPPAAVLTRIFSKQLVGKSKSFEQK